MWHYSNFCFLFSFVVTKSAFNVDSKTRQKEQTTKKSITKSRRIKEIINNKHRLKKTNVSQTNNNCYMYIDGLISKRCISIYFLFYRILKKLNKSVSIESLFIKIIQQILYSRSLWEFSSILYKKRKFRKKMIRPFQFLPSICISVCGGVSWKKVQ